MAVYISKEELGNVTINGRIAVVERVFSLAENGNVIARAGVAYQIDAAADNAGLPPIVADRIATLWTPEAVAAFRAADKAAVQSAAIAAREESEKERLARVAQFEADKDKAFGEAINALTEQRDAAFSAGDGETGGKIDAQINELVALRDAGKTIQGLDMPEELQPPAPLEGDQGDAGDQGDGN